MLDLGCGDGLVSSFILPKIEIGLDPDQTALDCARRLGIYQEVIAAGMENCQLADHSVGTMLSNSVQEHIPAIDAVLKAAARVLIPRGKLVFTVPTEAFSHNLFIRGQGYAARRNRQLQDLNLWPTLEWQRRLARAGLQIKKVRSYLRPGWVRAWDALELLQMVFLGNIRLFGWA